MATIGSFSFGVNAASTITETDLTGTDTLIYDASAALILRNSTAGSVTVTLHGALSTGSKLVEGGGSVDLSAPFSIALPAGAIKTVKLGSIRDLLVGAVTVSGGVTGVYAYMVK